ncbi:hypothetical protein QFC21_004463 [Naganishia friedmannii]|uniref:Uncharacterized protein n=1 Tax=Naganishia friedmannii TaxID=89922 RepID=A0ACC2VG56_9TREE|nr:hypothetical protein QFC21_004463 [Naganishia friedmannii]
MPGPTAPQDLRLRAIKLYKEKSDITDRKAIEENLALGEHVKKEVLAMLSLKKFRHLRRTYYNNDPPRASTT